jgi:hypothetical protein
MNNSCKRIEAKSERRYASWEENSKGLILKIGSRQASNNLRVYQKNNGLEFELEMKKAFIKSVQELLFSNCLKEFEDILTRHFYQKYYDSLILNTCYTDWLLDWWRKTAVLQKPINSLVTSYLKNTSFQPLFKEEEFFELLQFLSFIRELKFLKKFLNYYLIRFPLIDFLHFLEKDSKSTYQRTKVIHFLEGLQEMKPLVKKFSEKHFRSSVIFPYFELKKEGREWIVYLLIAGELYFYQYPFWFPRSFLLYQTKDELKVKLQLIESLSTIGFTKIFYVEDCILCKTLL